MIHAPVVTTKSFRPTQVEVNLSAIGQNYFAIRKYVGNKMVMAILKANAYGHGLIEVARHLSDIGVPYFGVAYLEEGLMLREQGIRTPILVMGGVVGEQIPAFIANDLTITASSIDKLHQIELCAQSMNQKAKVHLKIDTGMERIGIHHYNAHKLIEASITCKYCTIEGIFSHYARGDDNDAHFTRLQNERFEEVLKYYDDRDLPRPLVHMGNSGSMLQEDRVIGDMVRPGLLLYGIYPNEHWRDKIVVSPALTWKTRVVFFKVIEKNQPVSYDGTWVSARMTRIVTLPVGYGDGYFRSMSNKCQVLIRGKKYPVVGNICMDQMMVNIGWDEAYNGEEVVLIGRQNNAIITVADLAEWAGTIPYEILTNINTRVPRIYQY